MPKDYQTAGDRLCHWLLLLYIGLTCTIFDVTHLRIAAGGFSIHLTDFLIILLFTLGIGKRSFRSSTNVLCLIIFMVGLLVTVGNILFSSLSLNEAVRSLRSFVLYLLPLVFGQIFKSEEDVERFVKSLLIIAFFTALMMIVQYAVGTSIRIIASGRVEDLRTMGQATEAVTRILPPGQSLVLFAFLYLFAKWLDKSSEISNPPKLLFVIIGLGMFLTFNRSFWVGTVLFVLIFSYYRGVSAVVKNSLLLLAFALIGLSILFVLPGNKVTTAIMTRMDTLINITDTVEEDGSLTSRWDEFAQAWGVIKQNPFGLGVGADWRDAPSEFEFAAKYVHNGYLWVLLKLGFLGLIFFILLLLSVLKLRRKIMRNPIYGAFSVFTANSACAFVVVVYMINLVNPMFYQDFSIPLIGLSVGLMNMDTINAKVR